VTPIPDDTRTPDAAPPPSEAPVVGATQGDLRFRALGVHRLVIPIPFAEAGGSVNVYLIDNPDGSLTLFDAGLGTATAREALVAGFAALGRRLDEVRRIVVSHGHIDHYGSARFVRERSGAKVTIHAADAAKVMPGYGRDQRELWAEYLGRLGAPAELVAGIGEVHRRHLALAEPLGDIAYHAPGERLELGHFVAELVPMPGHTPGLCCLYAPEARFAFTADHLLARTSPNPLLELGPHGEADKFPALRTYLDSVTRLAALDLEWILPGHGPPFTGHRGVIDSLRVFYERRQGKLLRTLAPAPLTAYELVSRVFHRAGAGELFLMLSEIVGNLEVLEARGAVERVPGAVPYRYRVTAAG
jgi:glyoxylase-like metal-dependent hydrolase (beta-lactamase superfamily II)